MRYLTPLAARFCARVGALTFIVISKLTIYLFAFVAFLTCEKLVRGKCMEISKIYVQISDGMVSRQACLSGKRTPTV